MLYQPERSAVELLGPEPFTCHPEDQTADPALMLLHYLPRLHAGIIRAAAHGVVFDDGAP